MNIKAIARTDANFCRVFELPTAYPADFCFGGGHHVVLRMVDWFNPIPNPDIAMLGSTFPETWDECEQSLREFIAQKPYIKPGRTYLVLTDFGKAFTVRGSEIKELGI